MASILPDFEYDVFISYRHNDNRSGWVTEFVRALEEELASTIKEPVSVYFDTNPHDGLLETHNVDKSLEGKLKCLIFVPIISQTYCDTKSFAWQHEFCPFNAMAKADSLGRDIKLSNGNVSSRILPVKIHDLDAEDISILEQELGGVLRAIDFIFKSAGVNRPLTPGDKREENSNKTFYRDQVNKVANAIKDIISSLKNPIAAKTEVKNEGIPVVKPKPNYTIAILALVLLLVLAGYFLYSRLLPWVNQRGITDKSIAVLPFVDMSPGHDQEYLGDGIADGIITILSRIEDLKVIGRTSSFQFKGEKVDLREVGEKLSVSTVLEGSVMKVANNIRIDAKLISVKDGSQIWSESFNKPMDDILTIRDQISNAIFERMKLTISGDLNPTNQPKTNSESYENVLMGKYNLEFGPEKAMKAIPYFKKAIQQDSLNGDAYLALGGAYFFLPIIGEMSPGVCYDTVTALVNKALLLKCDGHLAHSLLFGVTYYYAWDWQRAKEEYEKCIAIRYAPSIAHALFLQDVYEDQAGAVKEMLGVLEHNPLYKDGLRILGATYANAGQFDQARMTLKRLIEIDPHYGSAYLELAWLCFREKKYDLALEYTKKSEEESPDLMRSKLHHVYFLARTGKKEEARSLFQSLDPKRIPTVGMAVINFALGNEEEGFKWMDKGFENHDPWLLSIRHNYEFDQLREDPRYIATVKKMNFPQ